MIGWLDTIIQGVLLGGLYALFAAGLSLIFGIMRMVNLAHGDLIILAAFAILAIANALGLSPFLAVLIALPIMSLVGFLLQHILINRTLGRDLLPPLLVTFGLSIIIENSLLEAFSADSQRLRVGTIETQSINLGGGIAVGVAPLLALISAAVVILALNSDFLSHLARPRISCHLGRSRDCPAHGDRSSKDFFDRDGPGCRGGDHRRSLSRY